MQPNPHGQKTSEFKVAIAAMMPALAWLISVFTPALQTYVSHLPPSTVLGGLIGPALVSAGFSISRGMAKQPIPPTEQQALITTMATQMAQAAVAEHFAKLVPIVPVAPGVNIPAAGVSGAVGPVCSPGLNGPVGVPASAANLIAEATGIGELTDPAKGGGI